MIIATHERIVDPMALLNSDPHIAESVRPGTSTVVSAADLNIEISKRAPHDPRQVGHTIMEISKVTGALYTVGANFGIETGPDVIDIYWGPSPTALDTMNEALDRDLSFEVLTAVNFEGPRGWQPKLQRHLGRKEYPVIYRPRLERKAHCEAIGAMLLPPNVMAEAVRLSRKRTRGKHAGYVALQFQETAQLFTGLLEQLWGVQDGVVSLDSVVNTMQEDSFTMLNPSFWKLGNPSRISTIRKKQPEIVEKTLVYLEDLRPKLQALKATSATK